MDNDSTVRQDKLSLSDWILWSQGKLKSKVTNSKKSRYSVL